MKKTLILLSILVLFCCKKKKTGGPEEAPVPAATGGTTNPPPAAPAFAAELTVTNTDHSYCYASGRFYGSSTEAIQLDEVKFNGAVMARGPGDEYRYAISSSLTTPLLWEISSGMAHIPDTSLYSPAFPALGFTKNISLTYDKTKDFSIPVDVSGCDSMFITLGTVQKKIAGKSGITSVTFRPADGVKYDSFDSTWVIVNAIASNYNVITVRGKKWKLRSDNTAQSHYIYK